MIELDLPVQSLMRDVAARIVMPRFRQLDAAQIEEKAPDELVTIADRESEEALAEGLRQLLPDSRVIARKLARRIRRCWRALAKARPGSSIRSTAPPISPLARRRSVSWSRWWWTESVKLHGCSIP